jgi:hypothetical protein
MNVFSTVSSLVRKPERSFRVRQLVPLQPWQAALNPCRKGFKWWSSRINGRCIDNRHDIGFNYTGAIIGTFKFDCNPSPPVERTYPLVRSTGGSILVGNALCRGTLNARSAGRQWCCKR